MDTLAKVHFVKGFVVGLVTGVKCSKVCRTDYFTVAKTGNYCPIQTSCGLVQKVYFFESAYCNYCIEAKCNQVIIQSDEWVIEA